MRFVPFNELTLNLRLLNSSHLPPSVAIFSPPRSSPTRTHIYTPWLPQIPEYLANAYKYESYAEVAQVQRFQLRTETSLQRILVMAEYQSMEIFRTAVGVSASCFACFLLGPISMFFFYLFFDVFAGALFATGCARLGWVGNTAEGFPPLFANSYASSSCIPVSRSVNIATRNAQWLLLI